MKILFVLENYLPHIGGAEVLFKNLAEGLVKKGHGVNILTHKIKGTKSFEIINSVKIYRQNCGHSRYLFTFFSIPKAIKLARRADLIQTTTYNGAFPAWVASKITRKKVVITILEVWVNKWRKLTEMGWFKSWTHNILERLIYFLNFDKYVCISKSTQKQLLNLGVKSKKTKVIYPGVDYEHWNPKKRNGKHIRQKLNLGKHFVYLFYGRPGISKGLEYLVKAVPLISKMIPNSKLLAIVSRDKAYEKKYQEMMRLIRRLRIEDKVLIHRTLPYKELPGYILAANCVVIPSLAEGFGFTTAESCALGKPVVASNAGSLPEVVSGKYVLVKPRSVEGIAKGVEMVYNKNYAKSKLKRFELKDNIKSYLNEYEKLVK